jgi:Carboxypeptidase regulatory-like domain
MTRFLTVWTMLLLVAVAPAGFAQKKSDNATRSVQGAVTNPDDSVAVGAVVYLKNVKTLQVRSFITKEDGQYHFYELSPDVDYELKAEFQGAASGSKTLSSFDSKKAATINLKLAGKK